MVTATAVRRARYAVDVMRKRAGRSDRSCPYCGGRNLSRTGSKYVLLTLYQCRDCGLKYRYPKDDAREAQRFYEEHYREDTVVDVPPEPELTKLVQNGFEGSKFDKSDKVAFISHWVQPGGSILDFGASFGYVLRQLERAGHTRLLGYELSAGRAALARDKVGVEVVSNLDQVREHSLAPFDCVFASHVIEHLPTLSNAFDLFADLVVVGGRLILWTPNASQEALERQGRESWAHLIGEPHTLAIDYPFLTAALPRHGFRPVFIGDPEAEELSLVAERVEGRQA